MEYAQQQNQPDEHFLFLKTVNVAGTFAIEDRRHVFEALTPNTRVRLYRECDNHHDGNAIRVESIRGEKLGYIPRGDAAIWAGIIDGGTCFAGWVKSADKSSGQIAVNIYQRLQLPIDDITSFKFSSCGFFGPNITFQIVFRSRKLLYEKYGAESGMFRQELELKFSDSCWEEFALPAIRKCNFNAWRVNYENNNVLDGTQWSLLVRKKGGRITKITGSNDYPEEWYFFAQFMNWCLDLNEIKGNGAFRIKPFHNLIRNYNCSDKKRLFDCSRSKA